MSLNNYGNSVYRHGYEDRDVLDGTTEEVFRESDSTFFCRVRDNFGAELKTMFNTLESSGAWHAESFLSEIETWQNQFPEELWRLDTQRKYIRTYNESFINGKGDPQFLKNMAQGKMKYTVKQWERSQEAYMASKYQSSAASSDNAVIRCTVPEGDLVVPTNYRLKLTPYDYMYLNVKYGTQSPIQVRVTTPGVPYEIPFTGNSVDIIDIYSVSRIQDLGDLSTTYPATVDTSKATRLKELHVGNNTEGYDNPSLTTMTLGANYLLEVLNVENVSGLTQSLNLSALNNLRELYAHGTNTSGVTFADGGKIEIAELPAITSVTMRNLLYLKDFDVVSFDKLTSLTIENCNTVDVKNILESAPNVNRVRITGIDWTLQDATLLERLYAMGGFDKNGYNTERSVLSGIVHVRIIKQKQFEDYQKAWSDLTIIPDGEVVPQYAVTFVNEDGTVLEVQYVDNGESAIDPTTRTENPLIPTKESDTQYNYVFAGWDTSLNNVFTDRIIKATYRPEIRSYTVKYVSNGSILQTHTGEYGSVVNYTGAVPTYTVEEGAPSYTYYLFDRWDKSGYIDGDKTINAVFAKCKYIDGYFDEKDLSNMTPVEIYALTKLSKLPNIPIDVSTVIEDLDEFEFTFGHDFIYDDIESEIIVDESSPMVFDGSNYYDTGIQLFDEDKDFVLAVDYEFATTNDEGKTLVECLSAFNEGFKLSYGAIGNSTKVKLDVGEASDVGVTDLGKREMLVIRHKKGETKLHIYNSKADNLDLEYVELSTGTETPFISNSTLVFGAHKVSNTNYNYRAVGNINWCKVWYTDLGDSICRELAAWYHEKVKFNACNCGCSVGRHFISNTNRQELTNLTLVASHLMLRNRTINDTNISTGGWKESILNKYLNARLYKALPIQIKALIKQVEIISTVGDRSNSTSTSDCYITIPSIVDVDSKYNYSPYSAESALSDPATISFMKDANSRRRAYPDGTFATYWLRSPSIEGTSKYYWFNVNDAGNTNGYATPNTKCGVLIEISF